MKRTSEPAVTNTQSPTGLLGLAAAGLALSALFAGCTTAPSSPQPASSVSPVSAAVAPDAVPSTTTESTTPKTAGISSESPEESGGSEVAGADHAPSEELTVVGKRIRRWLPIVGADWPDRDCRLSIRNVGRGKLRAIFIADIGRSGRAWRHVARLVAAGGVRATLVTLPGSDGNRPCTWSGAVVARASELVAELVGDGDGPVSLVGDTLAAHVALEVAAQGELGALHNLVLYDLVPYPWPLQSFVFKAYRRTHPPGLFANQSRIAPPGYLSLASNVSFPERDYPDKEARAELLHAFRRSDPVSVGYEFYRLAGPNGDLRPRIAGIDLPMLAIWPHGPTGSERRNSDEVAAQYADLQDVNLHVLKGHGAGAMLEAPDSIAGPILSFWERVEFLR